MSSFFYKIFRSKSSRAEMSTRVNLKELKAAAATDGSDSVEPSNDRTGQSTPPGNLQNARSRVDRMSVSRSGRFKANRRRRSGLFENPMVANRVGTDGLETKNAEDGGGVGTSGENVDGPRSRSDNNNKPSSFTDNVQDSGHVDCGNRSTVISLRSEL